MADKEVAAQLGIKCVTVRTYVARLQEKLGAANRTQLGRTVLHIEDRRNGHGAASNGHHATNGNRAIGQSGSRAVGQSGSRAVGQSGYRAIGLSGNEGAYRRLSTQPSAIRKASA